MLDIADGQFLFLAPTLGKSHLVFIALEDLPEGRGKVGGAMDIIPVEGDQPQEVHDLLIRFRVFQVKDCCDLLRIRSAAA